MLNEGRKEIENVPNSEMMFYIKLEKTQKIIKGSLIRKKIN